MARCNNVSFGFPLRDTKFFKAKLETKQTNATRVKIMGAVSSFRNNFTPLANVQNLTLKFKLAID